jgi:hypothetical protein
LRRKEHMVLPSAGSPQILEPREGQDFHKPIIIRWGLLDTEVVNWWLSIGSIQPCDEEGNWDILSEDMNLHTERTVDLSSVAELSGVRVLLLATVRDDALMPPERTIVSDPVVIKNRSSTYV